MIIDNLTSFYKKHTAQRKMSYAHKVEFYVTHTLSFPYQTTKTFHNMLGYSYG